MEPQRSTTDDVTALNFRLFFAVIVGLYIFGMFVTKCAPPKYADHLSQLLDQRMDIEVITITSERILTDRNESPLYAYRAVAYARHGENDAARRDVEQSTYLRFSFPQRRGKGRNTIPGRSTTCEGQVDQLILPHRFKEELWANLCGITKPAGG